MKVEDKALELVKNISKVLYIDESEITSIVIKYTKNISESKEKLVVSEAVGKINYRHNLDLNRVEDIKLNINLDKVKYIFKVAEPKTLKDLCLSNTITNLFIFVVINQLANYIRTRKLIEYNIIETVKILDSFNESTLADKETPFSPLINSKEVFANYYTCQKIHIVLKELGEMNRDYLTYLDNI